MKVLVACECSGVVRRAFRARGHDAWSCDIRPAADGGEHILGSVIDHEVVKLGWDLMIAHPDCTFLTVSANAWAGVEWRMEARHWALAFVKTLWAFPIPRICIENPIGVLPTIWRRWTQTIQPYDFGDDASKETCLYLKNLPPLVGTQRAAGRMVEWPKGSGKTVERWSNQTDSGQNKLPPSDDRWILRAETYPGIANAMVDQWGALPLERAA